METVLHVKYAPKSGKVEVDLPDPNVATGVLSSYIYDQIGKMNDVPATFLFHLTAFVVAASAGHEKEHNYFHHLLEILPEVVSEYEERFTKKEEADAR